jgi:dinuclear metal center YbgI/SA1388 family protein
MIKVKDISNYLESIAPISLQETYDNSGLLVGNNENLVSGIITTLDITEEIIQEAIDLKCNLIVAHHPIIFKGVKKLNGNNYVEKCIIKAIKNDINIYAIHTNLDNIHTGINRKIGEKLGFKKMHILQPKSDNLLKLTFFVPVNEAEKVLNAIHEAGAGQIGNYKNCSFSTIGEGTFMPNNDANPFIGNTNILERVNEKRVEVILPKHLKNKILEALKNHHPYEEVAYYLHELINTNQETGAGMYF